MKSRGKRCAKEGRWFWDFMQLSFGRWRLIWTDGKVNDEEY